MINPYANIDWENDLQLHSLSHIHSHSKNANQAFKSVTAIHGYGIHHLPYSNYYPSTPTDPIEGDTTNYYWSRGVAADTASYLAWKEENGISDNPATSLDKLLITGPNAEHHSVKDDNGTIISNLHIGGLGSTYESGSAPDVSPVGCQIAWKTLFANIIGGLKYSDAGGIIINHPNWTKSTGSGRILTNTDIFEMLDYDQDRVLGIEIYNYNDLDYAWDLDLFDRILSTGRRCWGTAAPDHYFPGYKEDYAPGGRNVLIVPSATDYQCMKAYRDGRFYAKLFNTALAFSSIIFNESSRLLSVEAANADTITFVTDKRRSSYSGENAAFYVPRNAVYVRVQAEGLDDMIFSQPIMLDAKKNMSGQIVLMSV